MATTITLNGAASPQELSSENIGTPVTVACTEGAGDWTFLDRPEDSAAAFASPTGVASTTFTPDKEGTYRIKCTRSGGGAGNEGEASFAITSDGHSDLREIGWKERLAHHARGWAHALNRVIRKTKQSYNRPKYVLVKVDAAYAGYSAAQRVWATVGTTTLPSGEVVPLVLPAASQTGGGAVTADYGQGLVWKPASVTGLVAGSLFLAQVEGFVDEAVAGAPAMGAPVFVAGTNGEISLAGAGLYRMTVGQVYWRDGVNYKIYFKPYAKWEAVFTGKGQIAVGSATAGEFVVFSPAGAADGDMLVKDSAAASGWNTQTPALLLSTILTTAGDLLYRGGGGVTRLAIGTANQILSVVAGAPAWIDFPGVLSSVLTTAGDLPYATAPGVWARLPIGSAGQILRVNGTGTALLWSSHSGSPITMFGGALDESTGGWVDTGQRFSFNGSTFPAFTLEAHGFGAGGATGVSVRLYNQTDGAAVANSEINIASTTAGSGTSGLVTFVAGDKEYRVQTRRDGGAGTGTLSWLSLFI